VSSNDPVDPAVARLLDDPAVWAEVPAGMRARVLDAAAGAAATRPPHAPPRHVAPPTVPAWRRPVLLAAAAVVVVCLAVAGGLRLVGDEPAEGVEVALSGTDEAPAATATARLRDEPAGVAVVLDVDGLPPAPDGTFYEAWLVGDLGKVSAGTFHQRGDQDDIQLWLGVDPGDYEAITVTRQPTAGGTPAEGVVVLRGELPNGG
jgi:hypothetical protein